MPKRAQFIRSHLPRVTSDPSPIRSRLGTERDLSFASHASPARVLAKNRRSVLSRSRERAFDVGAGGLEPGKADEPHYLAEAVNEYHARSSLTPHCFPGSPAVVPAGTTNTAAAVDHKPDIEIHCVAGHGVLAMTGTASTTGEDLSAGDTDMDADGTTNLSRHVGYRRAYSQRCTSGAFGIVAMRNGRPENSHDTVADMLVDAPAMLLDDPIGAVEELLEQGMNLFRIELLSPRRVASEIRKKYRYLPTLADRIVR
jgi:hypothetical protein